jgi:hypothetical protein
MRAASLDRPFILLPPPDASPPEDIRYLFDFIKIDFIACHTLFLYQIAIRLMPDIDTRSR